jgi:hypothetical protein
VTGPRPVIINSVSAFCRIENLVHSRQPTSFWECSKPTDFPLLFVNDQYWRGFELANRLRESVFYLQKVSTYGDWIMIQERALSRIRPPESGNQ